MINREMPTENAKPELSRVSPSRHCRRVIFPSLYSKRSNDDSTKPQETVQPPSIDPVPLTREDLAKVASSFQFRSPTLPERGSRMCDELGLDMPSRPLDVGIKSAPLVGVTGQKKKLVKASSRTVPPSLPTRTKSDSSTGTQPQNALSSPFPLSSPGLAPKSSPRVCDELGLDMPAMMLADDTSTISSSKPLLAPRAKVVNDKHFGRKAGAGVTRTSNNGSGNKASPQRKSRIDQRRKNFVASPPTTRRPSQPPRRKSCLRPSKWGSQHKDDATLDKSSVPSLVSLADGSNSSSDTLHSQVSTSDNSELSPARNAPRSVSFDARVWVLEYERTPEEIEKTWFSSDELDRFRKQTIARLVAHNTELLPSGTGFAVQRGSISSKAVFALPSMSSVAEEDDEDLLDERDVEDAVNAEIRNVLVVDPHDICAKLFKRDLKRMIPSVKVCTASSSTEARKLMAFCNRFDVMIVEERLKLFHNNDTADQCETSPEEEGHSSGSEFIKALVQERAAGPTEDNCLFIAVSAHLDKDKERMQANGADFIWTKPPPTMDEIVRDVLLKALLVKRQKHALADRLFGDVMGAP